MDNRLKLHALFEAILKSKNVYFQPPESVKIKYSAIVYALDDIESRHANDSVYGLRRRYLVTLITEDPDSTVIGELASLELCRFIRHYKSDNLNHYVFELYY